MITTSETAYHKQQTNKGNKANNYNDTGVLYNDNKNKYKHSTDYIIQELERLNWIHQPQY
jgi:hypothetical protein